MIPGCFAVPMAFPYDTRDCGVADYIEKGESFSLGACMPCLVVPPQFIWQLFLSTDEFFFKNF